MKLSLGISPCPNDTFIFDALINHKIDTEGLEFEVSFLDIDALNESAFNNELDVVKLSYYAYSQVWDNYKLLSSGSALGHGCGPLLIAKNDISFEGRSHKISVPGLFTTASLLFQLAYPQGHELLPTLFSEIENAVLSETVDGGLLIHETRFTFQDSGLHKICDLGEYWESTYNHPIPLGGIAINQKFEKPLQKKVERLIQKSLAHAFANRESVMPFITKHAQTMKPEVMKAHIDLYVNDYSLDLGVEGREAIETLYSVAKEKGIIEKNPENIFV